MSDPFNDKILAALNKQISDPKTRQKFAALAASVCQSGEIQHQVAPSQTQDQVNVLRQNGLILFGKRLDGKQISAILEAAQNYEPYLREGSLSYSPTEAIVASPHLIHAATDTDVLAIASEYIGAPATIVDVSLWCSMPGVETPVGNQVFHRDRAGFRTCKLFIYLTPAESNSGAHEYVLKSHDVAQTQAFLADRGYDSAQIEAFFVGNARDASDMVEQAFEGRVASIEGAAGDAFMTDNYGLHRGRPVESGCRWVFVAVYGVSDQRGTSAKTLATVKSTTVDRLRKNSPQLDHALRLFG